MTNVHPHKIRRSKPISRIKAGLTYYWFNKAKNYSGKSSAKIAAILDNKENLSDLEDGRKMQFARYANGGSSMDYAELRKFIKRCREMDLLPPPPKDIGGLRHRNIKECILELPDTENSIKKIAEFRDQFEEKKKALVKALIEYSDVIEEADSMDFLVLDLLSETPGNDLEADYIEDVHSSQLKKFAEVVSNHQRQFAKAVSCHHLMTDID